MRIRTRSLIILASRSLQQLTTIALAIILVRIMSKELYGTYRQVLLVTTFLTGLLCLNLPSSFYYFIPKTTLKERRKVINNLFAIAFLMSAIMAGFMYFGASYIADWFHNPPLKALLRTFCLYPFAAMALQQIPPFMISIDRPVRAGIYSLLTAVLFTSSVVVFVAIGWQLQSVLAGTLIILGVLSIIGLIDVYHFAPGKTKVSIDRALIGEIFTYVLPLFAATAVGVINVQFDKFLISTFFTAAMYAVYSCGAMEIPLVGMVTSSVTNAIMPNMVVLGNEKRFKELIELWKIATQKCALVIFPAFAILVVCAYDLMVVMYGKGYKDAAWPFMIYLFMLPIRVAVYGAVLRAIGRTKPVAIAAGLALITNVAVSLVLVIEGQGTMLAFVGPSIGTVAGTISAFLYMMYAIATNFSVSFKTIMPWRAMGRIMGLCIISGIIAFLVGSYFENDFIRLIIRVIVFSLVLMPIMWIRILDEDEKNMILKPIRIIKEKIKI